MKDKRGAGKQNKTPLGSQALGMLLGHMKDGSFRGLVQDWKWIFSYSLRYKWAVALYILLGVGGSIMGLAASLAGKYLIDIITAMDASRLWLLIAVFVGSTGLSIAFSALSSRISARVSVSIKNSIQAEVFDSIMDSRWLELTKFRHGDILNRFTDDVSSVASIAISWLPDLITYGFSFAATFCVILYYDVAMAFIAFASAPFLIFSSRFLMRKLREHNRKMKETMSGLTSFETEAFYNLDTLKSFGIEEKTGCMLRRQQEGYKSAVLDYNRFTVKTNVWLSVLGALVQFAAFGYCLWRLWTGAITFGTMTMFLQQRGSLSSSFSALAGLVPGAMSSAVSARRVRELVELEKEPHQERPAGTQDGGCTVIMSGVEVSYVPGEKTLENVEIIARPGEIVGLVGKSGGGKTTMVRLMLGLIAPETGNARISFQNGASLPLGADTRGYFSYVPQGNTMMSGTIADNLRLVRENASDEELVSALKIACAWDFVSRLPDGIYSFVGERGHGLSEGQCQRIAIARAILRDAPVLLMDEATSALDEATEKRLLDSIMTARPDRTIIVTTHRPGVLDMCSRVYRVENGAVSEERA